MADGTPEAPGPGPGADPLGGSPESEPGDPPLAQPPADAGDWTYDQWIEWLKATDAELESGPDAPPSRPVTTMGRMAHSSGGAVLGQAMLGLAAAIYGRHDDEVVIVAEGPGQPEDDGPITVHLDPDHPERSTVVVNRPPNTTDSAPPDDYEPDRSTSE